MKIKNKINHFLTNDLVFKIFFTNNEYMLKKLISMSIGIRYEDITNIKILNTEIVGENDDSKIGRLDLLVEINNKELINIEIQNADKYNLPQRIEYYLSRIYVNNIKMGEDYINLNKVYGIYILDYNDKNYPDFFSKLSDYDTINKKRSSSMKEKIIYNLTKIEEIDKYGFSEEEKNILRLIKSKDERELESMAVSNERIKEAMEQLEKINADDELKMELYYLEKQRLDENTSRRYREMAEEARKKAEQDCKKAEQECRLAQKESVLAQQELKKVEKEKEKMTDILIKTLYDSSKTIDEISNITNLDIEYIKNILNK